MSHLMNAQPGASPLSLQDVLSTVHNGCLGSDVHPLVLEAVVQVVLSNAEAGPSAIPSFDTARGLQVSDHRENPYWHLTQIPSQQWSSAPSYEAFWSKFERNTATSCTRTPSKIRVQGPPGVPTWSTIVPPSLSPQSYLTRNKSSSPSLAPPNSTVVHVPCLGYDSFSTPTKRKASSLEETIDDYPALADFIRVIPAHSSDKKVDPFPCSRCRKTVGGDLTTIHQHLVDVHSVQKKTPARCIFPGCDKIVLSGQMGSHIRNHQANDRARCGLCGKGFTRIESVVQHITSGTCQILKTVDAPEDSPRCHKRLRYT
ncbi:hypothetical protein FPV67DRAFT_1655972 [Lyophyllum atratum]|nr:hypothetical protein FPV67DRAFT_1655972 [Lyophyllum atratum]